MQAREDREELTQRRSSPENLSLLRNDELERQVGRINFILRAKYHVIVHRERCRKLPPPNLVF